MSNTVWVRWKDSTRNEWLTDKVRNLEGDADISDLRYAFVKDRKLDIDSAKVEVRETEDGEKLKSDALLSNYFFPASDKAVASGPGKTLKTALFFTLAQPQQQDGIACFVDTNCKSMKEFFGQSLENFKPLTVTDDSSLTSRWIETTRMGWFDNQLAKVYWRQCYSYIMCTTIAFFEHHYEKYKQAIKSNETSSFKAMVLTGVQGTGKSVLAPFIALFMSRAFGWKVHYYFAEHFYKDSNGQDESKQISICDLSIGQKHPPHGFVLLVSSANKDRWHDLQQQQAWVPDNNYCFIDVVSKSESEKMSPPESSGACVAEKFRIVGGVPRLHYSHKTVDGCKKLIDGIIGSMNLLESMRSLSNLCDKPSVAGEKHFPGLVGHIVPVDRFRNTFMIQAASPYVEKALYTQQKEKTDSAIKKLLNDLIGIPKARGFAGWIWEPLLSRQFKEAKVTIVGAQLPMQSSTNATSLLEVVCGTTKIRYFDFQEMSDFGKTAKSLLLKENTDELCAFVKAKSDTYPGIDAIIIKGRSDGNVVVAGQQITVAQTTHPVQEEALHLLVEACRRLENETGIHIETELWFLQPEKSLVDDFGFTHLQPLTFNKARLPDGGASGGTSSRNAGKRPWKKRKFYGQLVASDAVARMQSNDMAYWRETVKDVKQFVGIVRLDDAATDRRSERNSDGVAQDIARKLNEIHAHGTSRNKPSTPQDPPERSWDQTVAIFKKMKLHLDQDLYGLFEEDIHGDAQDLEEAGFKFQSSSSEDGALGIGDEAEDH